MGRRYHGLHFITRKQQLKEKDKTRAVQLEVTESVPKSLPDRLQDPSGQPGPADSGFSKCRGVPGLHLNITNL